MFTALSIALTVLLAGMFAGYLIVISRWCDQQRAAREDYARKFKR